MVDLPAPLNPVNHRSRGLLVLLLRVRVAVDVDRLPVNVARAPQGEVQHARRPRWRC